MPSNSRSTQQSWSQRLRDQLMVRAVEYGLLDHPMGQRLQKQVEFPEDMLQERIQERLQAIEEIERQYSGQEDGPLPPPQKIHRQFRRLIRLTRQGGQLDSEQITRLLDSVLPYHGESNPRGNVREILQWLLESDHLQDPHIAKLIDDWTYTQTEAEYQFYLKCLEHPRAGQETFEKFAWLLDFRYTWAGNLHPLLAEALGHPSFRQNEKVRTILTSNSHPYIFLALLQDIDNPEQRQEMIEQLHDRCQLEHLFRIIRQHFDQLPEVPDKTVLQPLLTSSESQLRQEAIRMIAKLEAAQRQQNTRETYRTQLLDEPSPSRSTDPPKEPPATIGQQIPRSR